MTPVERARRWKYANKYGVPVEWYDETLAAQDGRCAGCRNLPGARRLAVDHDHQTGAARGLLCTGCNQALGLFREDVTLLERAIEYLEAHRQRRVS